jgi:hypothetical protein
MRDMTPTIEKYSLKIYSIFNQITEIEKLIESKKGIGKYSSGNTEQIIIDTVLKLQNAKIELQNAIDCLLMPTREKQK